MNRQYIVSFFLLAVCLSLTGQELLYDVIRNGSSMGVTKVERRIVGDKTNYSLNTKTKFRIIFSFEVEYDLQESFDRGVLFSGTGFNTLNDGIQNETKLTKRQNDYELVSDGISTRISEVEIKDSVSEIYFEEPFDQKKVFSAYFGRYLVLVKTGDHQYSLTSPDGTNVYTYENGICTRVVVTRDFATFSQELQPHLLSAVRSNKFSSSKTK
ncbi:MAG: DUF6134 family protein [Marinoscillum sp.]